MRDETDEYDRPRKTPQAGEAAEAAHAASTDDDYRLACRAALKVARERSAELAALLQPRPARFLAWTIAHLAVWALAAAAIAAGTHWWIDSIAIVIMGSQLHALTVLQHECGHRSAFRSGKANLWMGRFLAWFIVFPFTAFTECHRRHHRYLGDPVRDPDEWHYADGLFWMFPRIATFAPRFTWLSLVRYGPDVRRAVARELVFNLVSMAAVALAFAWYGRIDLFALIVVAPLLVLTMIINPISRGYEHFPMATLGDDSHARLDLARNTITVTSPTIGLLWANINYHVEHHVYPAVPFYHLPRLHRLLRERPYQRDGMLLERAFDVRPDGEGGAPGGRVAAEKTGSRK